MNVLYFSRVQVFKAETCWYSIYGTAKVTCFRDRKYDRCPYSRSHHLLLLLLLPLHISSDSSWAINGSPLKNRRLLIWTEQITAECWGHRGNKHDTLQYKRKTGHARWIQEKRRQWSSARSRAINPCPLTNSGKRRGASSRKSFEQRKLQSKGNTTILLTKSVTICSSVRGGEGGGVVCSRFKGGETGHVLNFSAESTESPYRQFMAGYVIIL